jgi:hypothetical protein
LSNTEQIKLPKFPEKALFKMNNELIDKRRSELESWLNEAIKFDSLARHIFSFFNIVTDSPLASPKKHAPADSIAEFIKSINATSNNKIMLIENFVWVFFSKKSSVPEAKIIQLLTCLIPLCGDELVGRLALDCVNKLTTSDYYRDFDTVRNLLVNFPPSSLSLMQLNLFLTKRRFADSQIQAYNVCKIFEVAFGPAGLLQIVLFS